MPNSNPAGNSNINSLNHKSDVNPFQQASDAQKDGFKSRNGKYKNDGQNQKYDEDIDTQDGKD